MAAMRCGSTETRIWKHLPRPAGISTGHRWVPLTEHFSNSRFVATVDKLLGAGETALPIRIKPPLCACGCTQTVTMGRKFVNQAHYNHARGLSPAEAEQLATRFRQGVPKRQLAREYGIALTTVKRCSAEQDPTVSQSLQAAATAKSARDSLLWANEDVAGAGAQSMPERNHRQGQAVTCNRASAAANWYGAALLNRRPVRTPGGHR